MIDGDTIYASPWATSRRTSAAVGALAAEVLAFAIEDAVKSSQMEDDAFLRLICGE